MKKVLAVSMIALALSGCFNPDNVPGVGQDKNDVRILQNEKCLKAHMLPQLVEGEIVCAPDYGKMRISQYFDYLEAERVIREKTGKPLPEGFKPGDQDDMPLKQKVDRIKAKPASYDPNSFEHKHKVTL